MDQSINDQGSSSTEGREMKRGDEVWVKVKVLEVNGDSVRVSGHSAASWWMFSDHCKPVEPEAVVKQSLTVDAVNPSHYKQGPAETIDIIEAAIAKAPNNKAAGLHWQVLKYALRCWFKNGVEDLRKAKWYLNRLIDSFDESEAEQLATGEGTGEVKPPDGWRFLEVGEVIRKGDMPCKDGLIYATEPIMLGMTLQAHWKPMIRRNKFEVGEKVVAKDNHEIWEVDSLVNGVYQLRNGSVFFASFPEHLAPYIEETK